MSKTACPDDIGTLSSQRISELLHTITPDQREAFYQTWCQRRGEQEYLALDITSMSSYSELLQDVEWGYNRDQEHLPQVNLCMLRGGTSRLPIYQVLYSGSLKDVSTLDTALAKMDGRGVLFANSCRLFLALTTACPEGHEMATTSKLLGAGVTYSPRERSG